MVKNIINNIIKCPYIIEKPANLLLLKINTADYQKSDYKFMFFGQETNGWEQEIITWGE